jgi:hypothetical protein
MGAESHGAGLRGLAGFFLHPLLSHSTRADRDALEVPALEGLYGGRRAALPKAYHAVASWQSTLAKDLEACRVAARSGHEVTKTVAVRTQS